MLNSVIVRGCFPCSKRKCVFMFCLAVSTITLYFLMATEAPLLRMPIFQQHNNEDVSNKTNLNLRGHQTIPKIIHQIWNDENVPVEFMDNVKSLVRDNPPPDWKYYWWTKESGLKLVKDKFPSLMGIMNDVSDLMRSDILRYLVIYEFGGVYFDLDTVSVKSLNNFVETHRCSVALEPAEHFFAAQTDFLLTNSALFCIRRHTFFENLVLHVKRKPKNCKVAFKCTGPSVVSRVWKEFNKTGRFSGDLPDVQTSEVFQDVYDIKDQNKRLNKNCKNLAKLAPYQSNVCSNWISRGKENRNLSELALTYHTWFHVISKKMKISDKTHIKQIIPHSLIYEKDF